MKKMHINIWVVIMDIHTNTGMQLNFCESCMLFLVHILKYYVVVYLY